MTVSEPVTHGLEGGGPVRNSPDPRRPQHWARCRCGHTQISLRAGDAAEFIRRHAENPQPNETPDPVGGPRRG
ncbi:hypothetical protein PSA01_25450 [Pseudonocardia saturnea]|uniref:Uncharacterized protein n=1 Tax=Pseudonocardia saturnea TaxID=33909 RepID=A0ABQ0RY12_9PSEU|nr:hypothetical protein [Pseudonocardia autotrophica]BBG04185.1 hypothetical protein Pdca_53940 [Pseudonocardia autotrophica]GEC25516.1 hypothetical protein PSA01_25450 [Pseudonocardia saturnea]